MDSATLRRRIVLIWIAAPIILGLALFGPAGTLDYWQAWLYMATVFIPAFFVVIYFMKKDPAFLERRLRTKEKEAKQGLITKAVSVLFIVAFLVPGLDRRFGWSGVPAGVSLAADAFVLLGYLLVFLVFRENSYAGRTVQVDKGQTVVSTGPYSVIRHPMYLGALVMWFATPMALGSYAAAPLFLLLGPVIVLRIMNEEEVLRRDLPGYTEYCKRTRYRLLPFIW